MSWLHDVDQVTQGNALASRPRSAGGEWDELRSISRRTRRRLIGAGRMTPRGLAPDQMAELLADWFGRDFSSCEAVAWFVRESVRELDAAKRARWARQYQRRNQRAQQLGYSCLQVARAQGVRL